jgi:hypothetical protein
MLGKPVNVRHRNQSLDYLMASLIPLPKEKIGLEKEGQRKRKRLHL